MSKGRERKEGILTEGMSKNGKGRKEGILNGRDDKGKERKEGILNGRGVEGRERKEGMLHPALFNPTWSSPSACSTTGGPAIGGQRGALLTFDKVGLTCLWLRCSRCWGCLRPTPSA
jgi:hypothetical protein